MFLTVKVVDLGNWYRMFFDGQRIDVTLTFRKDNPAQVEYDFVFKPSGNSLLDYFLKVDTDVIN